MRNTSYRGWWGKFLRKVSLSLVNQNGDSLRGLSHVICRYRPPHPSQIILYRKPQVYCLSRLQTDNMSVLPRGTISTSRNSITSRSYFYLHIFHPLKLKSKDQRSEYFLICTLKNEKKGKPKNTSRTTAAFLATLQAFLSCFI